MWNFIECTQQGRSHVKQGIPCQDKTYSQSYGDTYTMALADGAGSARCSHVGAECVAKCISGELGNNFESYWEEENARTAKNRLYQEIYDSLQQLANEKECELKDLASTLLIVAVKDDRYIILHVGDGVIGYYKKGEIKVASAPNNGEFANTTVFTTSPIAYSQTRLLKGHLGDITGFVLMSDGPEACLYNRQKNELANGLLEIFEDAAVNDVDNITRGVKEAMENVISKHTMDDCSLAFMVKKVEAAGSSDIQSNEDAVEPDIAESEDAAGDVVASEENKVNDKSQKHHYLITYIILLVLIVVLIYVFV